MLGYVPDVLEPKLLGHKTLDKRLKSIIYKLLINLSLNFGNKKGQLSTRC